VIFFGFVIFVIFALQLWLGIELHLLCIVGLPVAQGSNIAVRDAVFDKLATWASRYYFDVIAHYLLGVWVDLDKTRNANPYCPHNVAVNILVEMLFQRRLSIFDSAIHMCVGRWAPLRDAKLIIKAIEHLIF